jgi:predicted Zn-dependent protease
MNTVRFNAVPRTVFQLLAIALLCIGAGCSTAPVTGRKQLNAIPDPVLRPMGASTYKEMLSTAKVDRKSADAKRLRKVGRRIARVATKPLYNWRYALIRDKDTINAWCLPGGKIAFYKGILPILKNEAGMAFVMGHEVGHAVAHHGAERLTQQAAMFGGLTALYLFLESRSDMPEDARNMRRRPTSSA